ncbi:MAG: acyl carrier protein [Anaerolinea sp.]|nr:acyl carrier protein [Anaerolinea sp.]
MNESEIKEILRAFITQELLGRAGYSLQEDEPLITGGLIDSFSLAHIGVFIEEAFGVYIPDPDLTVANMDTLNQMVRRVIIEQSG